MSNETNLLTQVDARTKLAGTNKLEALLFHLGVDERTGRKETYGINVFKIKEILPAPQITSAPGSHPAVVGMVGLRGELVPVINLNHYVGVQGDNKHNILIVTEYNNHVQGFLVHSIDTITHRDWSDIKTPPESVSGKDGLVTSITHLDDGRLAIILDVEKILADLGCYADDEVTYANLAPVANGEKHFVVYADDSHVARKQISTTLEKLGIRSREFTDGKQLWNFLKSLSDDHRNGGRKPSSIVSLVLTDIEMPEMDGFTLTKNIKAEQSLSEIPVLMHSSLSGDSNRKLGETVGVDDYVSKFSPTELSDKLRKLLKV